MFKNYFKIAIRQMKRQKMYAAIKIGGFALSIAACLLIALYIQDELNYESRTHHTNADTYNELSEDDLKQATTIIASLVYNTANRKEKLPRKPKPKPYGNFNFYIL